MVLNMQTPLKCDILHKLNFSVCEFLRNIKTISSLRLLRGRKTSVKANCLQQLP
jgi:hypothetical protein